MAQTQRLRLTYSKGEALRYVGHLDFVRAWERVLRRAGVPLAYSEGFNPQPKLQFASALPLGATGTHELLDVILSEPMAPGAFLEQVRPQLPAGLDLLASTEVPLKTAALQARMLSSTWQIDVASDLGGDDLAHRIEELLARDSIPRSRQRKGRPALYDLRPLILALRYEGQPGAGWHRLLLQVRSAPSATGRPDEVLAALGLDEYPARMQRVACHYGPDT